MRGHTRWTMVATAVVTVGLASAAASLVSGSSPHSDESAAADTSASQPGSQRRAGTTNAGRRGTGIAPARVAAVDTLRVVRALMESSDLVEAREDLRDELSPQVQALQQRAQQLAAQLQNMEPDDPSLGQTRSQYQQVVQQFQQAAQQANSQLDSLSAEQALDAFRTVRDAVQELADELGYTHVFSAVARYEEMGAAGTSAATQEIIARQLLVWPADDDITERVMEHLGVEDPDSPDAPASGSDPEPLPIPGAMPQPEDNQGSSAGPGRPTTSGGTGSGGQR